MRNKKKSFLLMCVSIISGVFAIFGVKNYIEASINTKLQDYAMIETIVAFKDISANTVLKENFLATRKVPKKFISSDSIFTGQDYLRLIGKRIKHDVKRADMIRWCDVEEPDDHLSYLIPDNKRSLLLKNIQGVSPVLIKPEDYIDILIYRKASSGNEESSNTLLQKVFVLAVGEQTSKLKKANKSSNSLSVLVTYQEAKLLVLAQNNGNLFAVLRNPHNKDIETDLRPITLEDIDPNECEINLIKVKKSN